MQSNAWIIFDCQTANHCRQHSHWNSTRPGYFLPPDTEQGPQGTHLFVGLENQLGNILLGSRASGCWAYLAPDPFTPRVLSKRLAEPSGAGIKLSEDLGLERMKGSESGSRGGFSVLPCLVLTPSLSVAINATSCEPTFSLCVRVYHFSNTREVSSAACRVPSVCSALYLALRGKQ